MAAESEQHRAESSGARQNAAQHSTAQHSTAQCSKAQRPHHQGQVLEHQEERQAQQGSGKQHAKHCAPGPLRRGVSFQQLCGSGDRRNSEGTRGHGGSVLH